MSKRILKVGDVVMFSNKHKYTWAQYGEDAILGHIAIIHRYELRRPYPYYRLIVSYKDPRTENKDCVMPVSENEIEYLGEL